MGVAANLLSKSQATKHAQMAAFYSAHKRQVPVTQKIAEIGILLVYVVHIYHYDWVPTILSL